MQDEFVTVKRFAERANVSTQAVYARINSDLQGFVRLDGSKKTVDTAALRYFGQQEVQAELPAEPGIDREMYSLLNMQLTLVNQKVFIRDEQINRLLEQLKMQSELAISAQHREQLALAELETVKQLPAPEPPAPWWKFWVNKKDAGN